MTNGREHKYGVDDIISHDVWTAMGMYGPNVAQASDTFNPLKPGVVQFADATLDTNDIHRNVDGSSEVISPGFLQNCTAIVLSRKPVNMCGINTRDYPYSINKSEMPAFVVTGLGYSLSARFNAYNREADVELRNLHGGLMYALHRTLYREALLNLPAKNGESFHKCPFRISGGDSIQNFGHLIGSESSESNLRALAGSSSAICDAVEKGKLRDPRKEGVDVIYSGGQEFYLDASRTLDLRKGINMELYMSNPDNFAVLGKNTAISVVGRDESERIVYHFNAQLSSKDKRMASLAVRKALKQRN
ncbi:MAG: hypothetical protein MUF61_03410 [archaeon]|jgi:hypothetical protein|nr:hypothetical protein [archaeon]